MPTVCANSCLYAEISCGPPLSPPYTNLLWDHTSRPGSMVLYECMDGFYLQSGNNISICSISGVWGEVSVKCKGKVTVFKCRNVSVKLWESHLRLLTCY